MRFESVSRTHVGLRRKVNEDSLLARPERGLWVVADGMGGHDAGEVASALVVQALGNLPETSSLDALVDEVVVALERVNRGLLRMAHSDMRPKTIGSTVAGVALAEDRYRCFWAGDSRVLRIRGRDIVQLTRDHSLVQDLVAAGMLAPEEAHDHPQANVITRAVGVSETLRVDTADGDAAPGDIFLAASDGLTRLVEPDELAAELSRQPLEPAADRLIQMVLERGAPDNVSLVLARII